MALTVETLQRALKNLEWERSQVLFTNSNRTKRERQEILKEVEEIDDQIDDVIRMLDRAQGWGSGRSFGRRFRAKAWEDKPSAAMEAYDDGRYAK